MSRFTLFLAAVALTGTALAQPADRTAPADEYVRWSVNASRSGKLPAEFMLELSRRGDSMHRSIDPADAALSGLLGALRQSERGRDVRFVLDREAGRLDCAGEAGRGKGEGRCTFAPSAAFARALAERGIVMDRDADAFTLTMVDAHVALVDDLRRVGVAVRTSEELAGLCALEVSARWVEGLIAAGRKSPTVETLLGFKALGIDPDYVRGLATAGYGDISDRKLLEFKALNITPGYAQAMNGKTVGSSAPEAGEVD